MGGQGRRPELPVHGRPRRRGALRLRQGGDHRGRRPQGPPHPGPADRRPSSRELRAVARAARRAARRRRATSASSASTRCVDPDGGLTRCWRSTPGTTCRPTRSGCRSGSSARVSVALARHYPLRLHRAAAVRRRAPARSASCCSTAPAARAAGQQLRHGQRRPPAQRARSTAGSTACSSRTTRRALTALDAGIEPPGSRRDGGRTMTEQLDGSGYRRHRAGRAVRHPAVRLRRRRARRPADRAARAAAPGAGGLLLAEVQPERQRLRAAARAAARGPRSPRWPSCVTARRAGVPAGGHHLPRPGQEPPRSSTPASTTGIYAIVCESFDELALIDRLAARPRAGASRVAAAGQPRLRGQGLPADHGRQAAPVRHRRGSSCSADARPAPGPARGRAADRHPGLPGHPDPRRGRRSSQNTRRDPSSSPSGCRGRLGIPLELVDIGGGLGVAVLRRRAATSTSTVLDRASSTR